MRLKMELGIGDRISVRGEVYEVKTVSLSSFEGRMAALMDESDNFQVGDVRMDLETERLVRLNCSLMTEEELWDRDDIDSMPWLVEDVLSGQVYTRNDDKLGRETWNAMETLAWASEEHHPNVEIEGD